MTQTMTQPTAFDYPARLRKLRDLLRRANLDAAAFVPGPNFVYLTGLPFAQTASRPMALILRAEGDAAPPALIVPMLEAPKVDGREPYPIQQFRYTDAEGAEFGFERACAALALAGGRIGVEGLKMRVLEGKLLERFAPGASVEPADEWLLWLRIHKDQAEIEAMRRAIALSEAALEVTVAQARPGMTERQLEAILMRALAEAGGADAFEPLVVAGPNSALPHGSSTDRPIREGDFLLFDFGAKIDGYASDITRTFVVGAPDPQLTTIYETVRAANQAAIDAAGPGVPAQAVDRAARRVIAEAGYGEYFIHRTGHGLGLDIHEAPYIREGNPMALEPGMTFTIEPGIYVPGLGGVRIEDDVLITPDGVEVLTRYPKQLRVIGG